MPDDSNLGLIDQKELTLAVGEIYAAAETPSLWPIALRRITHLVESTGAALAARYVNASASDVQVVSGVDPAMMKEFNEHYCTVNAWAQRMDQMFPVGAVGYSHLAIPDRELRKTEFYAGWLKPNGLGYCMGVIAANSDQPPALLTCIRPPEQGPFDERQGIILETLLPHIQRALRLHRELATLRSSEQGLESALDAFGHAVIGLNGNGKVLFVNQTARSLLAASDGLRIKDGRLVADVAGDDEELQFRCAQAASAGSGFAASGALVVHRSCGRPRLRVALVPFARNLLPQIAELSVLVFLYDSARKPVSRATLLRAFFKLSPAEIRLTELLASGIEVTAAAEYLRMSTLTARFHLSSVFRKTGMRRQSDLIRLVLNLPDTTRYSVHEQASEQR